MKCLRKVSDQDTKYNMVLVTAHTDSTNLDHWNELMVYINDCLQVPKTQAMCKYCQGTQLCHGWKLGDVPFCDYHILAFSSTKGLIIVWFLEAWTLLTQQYGKSSVNRPCMIVMWVILWPWLSQTYFWDFITSQANNYCIPVTWSTHYNHIIITWQFNSYMANK